MRTEVSALSTGTDLGNYLGRSTELPGAPDYPRTVGYSNVGVVLRVGSVVERLHVGDRVFSTRPHQSAYIARQDDLLVRIPDGVSSEHASLAYLTQVGMAYLRAAGYQSGESVAVLGLGVIGLCTIGLARAMGSRVAGIANTPLRLPVALRVGANAAFLNSDVRTAKDLGELFGEDGVDIVILTANTWAAFRLSVEIARCGGRISVLGFPGRGQPAPDFNPLDPSWFYGKRLTLIGGGASSKVDCSPADIRFNLRRN